ncbi:DUF4190 domain-containing protein [Ktedonosporobacter rubrisoli]|uniref:DUF4190 domain-containing protein n=1 Tax=Ktedonosporobacter rubrisoli TaxID=2509675 RepID=A0A4P6JXV6_KTERU|nr:DUF4190 domain-containing protein [Ktedonosporobacter rubrisoli]QBD79856.1 DUF4190 domain-containing protein [Ktedonosporobacter rubrisoli]
MQEMASSYNSDNSEWQLKPQASYPTPPNPHTPEQAERDYQPALYSEQPHPQQNTYTPYRASALEPQPHIAIPVQSPSYRYQPGFVPLTFDPYSNAAQTTLILGIVASAAWIMPFLGWLASFICAIIGVITFFQGRKSVTRHGSAVAGLALCTIVLTVMGLSLLLFGGAILALLAL